MTDSGMMFLIFIIAVFIAFSGVLVWGSSTASKSE